MTPNDMDEDSQRLFETIMSAQKQAQEISAIFHGLPIPQCIAALGIAMEFCTFADTDMAGPEAIFKIARMTASNIRKNVDALKNGVQ